MRSCGLRERAQEARELGCASRKRVLMTTEGCNGSLSGNRSSHGRMPWLAAQQRGMRGWRGSNAGVEAIGCRIGWTSRRFQVRYTEQGGRASTAKTQQILSTLLCKTAALKMVATHLTGPQGRRGLEAEEGATAPPSRECRGPRVSPPSMDTWRDNAPSLPDLSNFPWPASSANLALTLTPISNVRQRGGASSSCSCRRTVEPHRLRAPRLDNALGLEDQQPAVFAWLCLRCRVGSPSGTRHSPRHKTQRLYPPCSTSQQGIAGPLG
jgi:hypothetical protein